MSQTEAGRGRARRTTETARGGRAATPVAGATRNRPALAIATLLVWASLLWSSAPSAAARNDEVDYVALAALLARDGEYERAEQALASVDADADGIDRITFHTVRGLLARQAQQHAQAVEEFAAAAAAAATGEADPLLHLYRAQSLFAVERYAEALAAIEAAGDAVLPLSGAWLMRAHAQWMLGQRQPALDTLAAAGARFADNTSFQRRQVLYLIEAGLFAEAARIGREQLAGSDAGPDDFVAIGTALRRAGSIDEALRFLETARLRHPGHGGIARALAQAWLERGHPLAAAEVLAPQAEREPELLVEVAELFRRAGHLQRALALNGRVADPASKLKQRVGLLLELRRYTQVTALEPALARASLLGDEDLRYALAYAHYLQGDFEAAEKHLTRLTRPELFRRATELRRLMQDCGAERWSCA